MNAKSGYLLIVEDDPDILKLLDTTLTFKGYRVVKAHNGKEGLDIIHKEQPEIIIADIMMPKLDGFGLVHRLRLDPETRNIPVIFITATYVTEEDKEFALNIGATRFLQKPVDMDQFLTTITELLKHGAPTVTESLKEFNFYDGYRIRIETKLAQKNKQIAREELLLESRTDETNEALHASLRLAMSERDELKALLNQVHKQLEKYPKPK